MLHVISGSKVDGRIDTIPDVTTRKPNPLPPVTGRQRTIVFMKKQTSVGQDLFLRGGKEKVDHQAENNSKCIKLY